MYRIITLRFFSAVCQNYRFSFALLKLVWVDFRVRMFRISWIKFRLELPKCWNWVNSFECVKHDFQLICESTKELVICSVFSCDFYNFHFKFIHFQSTIYLNSIAYCKHIKHKRDKTFASKKKKKESLLCVCVCVINTSLSFHATFPLNEIALFSVEFHCAHAIGIDVFHRKIM